MSSGSNPPENPSLHMAEGLGELKEKCVNLELNNGALTEKIGKLGTRIDKIERLKRDAIIAISIIGCFATAILAIGFFLIDKGVIKISLPSLEKEIVNVESRNDSNAKQNANYRAGSDKH